MTSWRCTRTSPSYLREGYNQARAERNLALGFVMVTYQKMLASSSYAVRQSFRRRIAKLKGQLNDAAAAAKPVSENHLEELRDAEEATTALTELEYAAVDPGGLLLEIKQLEDLVERLGHVRDSKAETLLTALDGIFGGRPAGEGRCLHPVHRDAGVPGRSLEAERLHGVGLQRADEPGREGGGRPQLQGTGSDPDLDRGRR